MDISCLNMEILGNPLKSIDIKRIARKSHPIHGNLCKCYLCAWKYMGIHGNPLISIETRGNSTRCIEIHGHSVSEFGNTMESMEIHWYQSKSTDIVPNPWTSMEILLLRMERHGSPWKSIDINRSPWKPYPSHWNPWTCYWCTWKYMGIHGKSLISKEANGNLTQSMEIYGSLICAHEHTWETMEIHVYQ